MTIKIVLKLVVARARLVHQMLSNNGTLAEVCCSVIKAMAAISLCLSEEEQHIVGVASVNDPNSIVISRERGVVEMVLTSLGNMVFICRYHTPSIFIVSCVSCNSFYLC